MSSDFPKLPRPNLTEEILRAILGDIRKDGWQVFGDDHDRLVIQTDPNRQVLLEVHDGRCSIHFKNTQGPEATGFAVETRPQLEEALRNILRRHKPPTRADKEPNHEHSASSRQLATVLYTDIVNSTGKAVELGDREWHSLLEKHRVLVRARLFEFSGREIDTPGDGFLALFDTPSNGVLAARVITEDGQRLGIKVRAGLHTGEVTVSGQKPTGIGLHIGARVVKLAMGGEVLVSSTVKDSVMGSDLKFTDRGTQILEGIPGEWHLFSLDQAHSAANNS